MKKLDAIGIIVLVIALVLLIPLIVHTAFNRVEFNQFLIQRLELSSGLISPENFADMVFSLHSSGVNILSGKTVSAPPSLADPKAVFEYVFSYIPPAAVVYPTEEFYYFETDLNGLRIRGNLRVADIPKGTMSFVYFSTDENKPVFQQLDLNADRGVQLEQKNEHLYSVKYKEKTVLFKIPTTHREPPEKTVLYPGEEFVGHIHDESGIKFFLVFNQDTNSFYELLDDEAGVADSFEDLGDQFLLGKRTAFVYFDDSNAKRKILLGVFSKNARANNYFDGPGDQVPIRASLKEKLNIAYPSTILGKGIDEHGVYLNKPEWVRFALTPFQAYNSLLQVTERKTCEEEPTKSKFWTCLTRESWNTPKWRAEVERQLSAEGKEIPNRNE